MSLAKGKTKSSKKQQQQQWPDSLYLKDEEQDNHHRYSKQPDDWDRNGSMEGYDVSKHFGTPPRYRNISGSPPFLNISTPPPPFVHRPHRKTQYERNRAWYDQRGRLSTIPERGSKGIAGAGRIPGTLTASEIAEVSSNVDNIKVSGNPAGNGGKKKTEKVPMKNLKNKKTIVSTTNGTHPVKKSEDGKEDPPHVKFNEIKHLRIIIAAVVILVVLLLIASGVAVYISLFLVDGNDNIRLFYFTVTLRGTDYSADLSDPVSDDFITLQKDICDTMSAIHTDLKFCEVTKFRNGSVITNFTLGTPKESQDEYKSINPGKMYLDYLIILTKMAWTSPSAPDNVKKFVDKYDPDSDSLRSNSTTEATPKTTATVSVSTTLTVTTENTTVTTEATTSVSKPNTETTISVSSTPEMSSVSLSSEVPSTTASSSSSSVVSTPSTTQATSTVGSVVENTTTVEPTSVANVVSSLETSTSMEPTTAETPMTSTSNDTSSAMGPTSTSIAPTTSSPVLITSTDEISTNETSTYESPNNETSTQTIP